MISPPGWWECRCPLLHRYFDVCIKCGDSRPGVSLKVRSTTDGRRLFWCVGCDEPHGLDHGWTFNGDTDHPTFRPSVVVTGFNSHGVERRCHFFVTNGRLEYQSDCSHGLKGQTVDLPEWPSTNST